MDGFLVSVVRASQHKPLRCIHCPNLTAPTSLLDNLLYLNQRHLRHLSRRSPDLIHRYLLRVQISHRLGESSSTMAMINQIRRRSGQPTPYFVRGPPGQYDRAVALLLLDYTYPCGPHCRGLVVIPAWQGRSAAAVAPMIELDLEWQKAQDVSTLLATIYLSSSQC